jgi:enolase-phosphatase E1
MTLTLLDIEGTTTPISFVHDTLFPYARAALPGFLTRHAQDPDVRADLELVAEFARDTPESPSVSGDLPHAEVLANLLWQMDHDVKATGLKSLQGKIWKDGYARGELVASLFDDVHDVLRTLHGRGAPARIYSSGSVAAQRLLFGHTAHGDLTPLLAGYFDTTTGPKKVASSYEAIARACGVPTSDVFFATDHPDEARAARDAGARAVLLDRPGNAALPEDHGFEVWTDLTGLLSL